MQLFAKALNWKRYYRAAIGAYLRDDVLEVGAGIGTNSALFSDYVRRNWVCLEPDPVLAAQLPQEPREGFRSVIGTTEDLAASDLFDTILYIDVLEHIEDDRAELNRAARHLRRSGVIVVLAPAHQLLYTPFDKAIGHWRRYNAAALTNITPPGLRIANVKYLDAAGLVASLGNRIVLRSSTPTEQQILFWDRCLIPMSRFFDRLLRYRVGKSILCVWEKPA